MSEVNDIPALPVTIAFRKVERGIKWTPKIIQADPQGPEFKLPVRWLSPRRQQEIMAPGYMKLTAQQLSGNEAADPDEEAAAAVSQFRAIGACNRDMCRSMVDFDTCSADPAAVGFTIKNCEDLMDGEEVISPPVTGNPEEDEAAKKAFETFRAQNQIIPFTIELMNVLLNNAPMEKFQAVLLKARDAWEKKEAKGDSEGNAGSPTSPAA